MEELEVPTEHLHEALHESAHHSEGTWILKVALTAALLAVFAAITALFAGHHANEAMIAQIKSSDQWAYYQAKGIKLAVLESKMEMLASLGKEQSAKDTEKAVAYKEEQDFHCYLCHFGAYKNKMAVVRKYSPGVSRPGIPGNGNVNKNITNF